MDHSAIMFPWALLKHVYHDADSGSATLFGAGLVAMLLFTSVLITLLVWLRYLAIMGLIALVIRTAIQWLNWSTDKT